MALRSNRIFFFSSINFLFFLMFDKEIGGRRQLDTENQERVPLLFVEIKYVGFFYYYFISRFFNEILMMIN